jgi:uncharacterized protein (DUF927 family)
MSKVVPIRPAQDYREEPLFPAMKEEEPVLMDLEDLHHACETVARHLGLSQKCRENLEKMGISNPLGFGMVPELEDDLDAALLAAAAELGDEIAQAVGLEKVEAEDGIRWQIRAGDLRGRLVFPVFGRDGLIRGLRAGEDRLIGDGQDATNWIRPPSRSETEEKRAIITFGQRMGAIKRAADEGCLIVDLVWEHEKSLKSFPRDTWHTADEIIGLIKILKQKGIRTVDLDLPRSTPAHTEFWLTLAAAVEAAMNGTRLRVKKDDRFQGEAAVRERLEKLEQSLQEQLGGGVGALGYVLSSQVAAKELVENAKKFRLIRPPGDLISELIGLPPLPRACKKMRAVQKFQVRNDGVHRIEKDDAETKLTSGPVIPVAKITNIDNEFEEVILAQYQDCNGGGRWKKILTSMSTLSSASRLSELAQQGLHVDAETARSLSRYLSLATRENEGILPQAMSTSRMGMIRVGVDGEWKAVLGKSVISAKEQKNAVATETDVDDLDGALIYKPATTGDAFLQKVYQQKGTLQGQKEGIALIEGHPKALVVMVAALCAPLIPTTGQSGFMLSVHGPNGTSKSTVTRQAAAQWGIPHDREGAGQRSQEMPWSSTYASITLRASTLSGIPLILDDSKHFAREKDGGQKASAVIYALTGSEKERADQSGLGGREKRVIATMAISTGETALSNLIPPNDGGAMERILEISQPFVKSMEMKRLSVEIASSYYSHYGHIGHIWVKYLLEKFQEEGFEKDIRDAIKLESQRLEEQHPTNLSAGRLSMYAALVNITGTLINRAGIYPFQITEKEVNGSPLASHAAVIDGDIWKDMLSHAEDSSGEGKALEKVYNWAVSNQTKFFGRYEKRINNYTGKVEEIIPNVVYGSWRNDENGEEWTRLYVAEDRLISYLESQEFMPKQVLTNWRDKGIISIDTDGRKRFTKKMSKRDCPGGVQQRMVAIERKKIIELTGLGKPEGREYVQEDMNFEMDESMLVEMEV